MEQKETLLLLNESFANALPDSTQFTFHHLSTPPTRCDALFSALAKSKPDRTYRESHLLLASINDNNNINNNNENNKNNKTKESPNGDHEAHSQQQNQQEEQQQEQEKKTRVVPVLAIEIIIYTTKHLTTLFVSKADSTGYLTLLDLPPPAVSGHHSSPARSICTTFISHLVRNRRRPRTKLVVSLFARAQDQYLFPGSVDNGTKHVLDDRGLVKWWCKVLDPVIRTSEWKKKKKVRDAGNGDVEENNDESLNREMGRKENGTDAAATNAMGYLIVPGFDKYELTAFFPPSWRSDPADQKRWKCGHPLYEISDASDAPNTPPRCLIPHFPDDPKARFLIDLDEEIPSLMSNSSASSNSQINSSPSKKTKMDQWRSVKTLDQFWEMMAFRQECSSGRLVGFIWAVFFPAKGEDDDNLSSSTRPTLSPSKNTQSEQQSVSHTDNPPCSQDSDSSHPHKSKKQKELRGPIIPRQPRIKSSSSSISTSTSTSTSSLLSFGSSSLVKDTTNKPEQTEYYSWPKDSRGELLLSDKDYTRATEMLLRLDFSSLDCAISSFARWTQEISILARRSTWGQKVIGKKKADNPITTTTTSAGNRTNVPKTSSMFHHHNNIPVVTEGQPSSNNPSDDSLKRKIEHRDLYHQQHHQQQQQPVNILGSGLVKKKKKKEDVIPTSTLQQ